MSSNGVVAAYIKRDDVGQRITELLGKRAPQFVTTLVTAVNENKKLSECDPQSVLNAAFTAASMDLPINPNLGFAYLIPYTLDRGKATERNECQFQMGYKGFIQLAQRSGYYKTINARDVRQGEIVGEDFVSGEMEFKRLTEDRDKAEIVGYIAFFELLNGFRKTLYMTKEEVMSHAKKYSKNFAKWNSGLWKDDFDAMASKTVIKLLLSKYGPLSTQLQEAIAKDQQVDGEYDDNPRNKPELSDDDKSKIKDEASSLADKLEKEAKNE